MYRYQTTEASEKAVQTHHRTNDPLALALSYDHIIFTPDPSFSLDRRTWPLSLQSDPRSASVSLPVSTPPRIKCRAAQLNCSAHTALPTCHTHTRVLAIRITREKKKLKRRERSLAGAVSLARSWPGCCVRAQLQESHKVSCSWGQGSPLLSSGSFNPRGEE